MTPRVSVVLPAFNGEAFIADAVASVRAQALDALEIVVVDDGSSDSTPAIVQRMGPDVRCVRQPRGGPAAARNRGISLARADLVAFIDQDDMWPPNQLRTLMALLDANPSAQVATGLTQALVIAGHEGERATFAPYGNPWRAPHVGAALFRRGVFDIVGRLNATLRYCGDDLDWFMRARELGVGIVATDLVTLLFRVHDANTSRDALFRKNALIEAVRASINRRRGH
jgi:glycosyltransferase involved in cell wall biosynthesis